MKDLSEISVTVIICTLFMLIAGAFRYGCMYADTEVRRDVVHHSHEYIESKVTMITELDMRRQSAPPENQASIQRMIDQQCALLPEEALAQVRGICPR